MDKEKIESVYIVCRERATDDYDVYYCVGARGVTRIEDSSFSTEPYCVTPRYDIYGGDNIIASVINPDEVKYARR